MRETCGFGIEASGAGWVTAFLMRIRERSSGDVLKGGRFVYLFAFNHVSS